MDLSLTSNLAWRKLSSGANVANSTSQNPVASSLGIVPQTNQLALMTATVSQGSRSDKHHGSRSDKSLYLLI
jgi:hypothetical protein